METTTQLATLTFAVVALLLDGLIVLVAGWSHHSTLRALLREATGPLPLLAHLTLIAVLYWQMRRMPVFQHAPGVLLILGLMLFVGPAGTAMGFLATLVYALIPESWTPMADSFPSEELTPDKKPTAVGHIALEPQSLCDVFRSGTLAQKRRAVSLIGANFKPEFAEALRMALRDEQNAIRVQAGMVLLKLEDEFGSKQLDLQAQGDELLAEFGFGEDHTHLELARLYDQQAYSGLLDASRTKTARIQALREYRAHLAQHPDDDEAIAAVGRLLIREDQHQLVADWFGQQVREGKKSDAVLMWLAEALYRSRRYGELQAIVAEHGERLARKLPQDSALRSALLLWQAPPAPGGERAGPA